MTTKYTPGPWGLESVTRGDDGSDLIVTAGDGGWKIAHCRGSSTMPDTEESEANARLIAAAPSLAAALLKLTNEASGFLSMANTVDHGITNMRLLRLRIGEARSVLEKAGVE